ncbi:MAG: hydroxymethylbilane synthase [Deltaproteobacteria bacterium]|nr:hydroxymethylbilane synthase [Deltaproteobacteria bacterium]
MKIRIGTRGSRLAIVQCAWVRDRLREHHPSVEVELVRIKTKGDKILDSPLSKIGGKGLFVKEIEEALLAGRIDLAVHSMKDVPAALPEGLVLTAYPEREDPHDVLVSNGDIPLAGIPHRGRLGTSSLRRAAQALHQRPDLVILPLRGNVDTRLKKLRKGAFDAVILAAAGMTRLGLGEEISQVLPTEVVLPAIGQGALGLEVREDNDAVIDLLSPLNHAPTEWAVRAERAFLQRLEGGCQVPIAGFARLHKEELVFEGMVAELDGSRLLRDEIRGTKEQAQEMGVSLAERLIAAGAGEILGRVYGRDEKR